MDYCKKEAIEMMDWLRRRWVNEERIYDLYEECKDHIKVEVKRYESEGRVGHDEIEIMVKIRIGKDEGHVVEILREWEYEEYIKKDKREIIERGLKKWREECEKMKKKLTMRKS